LLIDFYVNISTWLYIRVYLLFITKQTGLGNMNQLNIFYMVFARLVN